MGRNPSSSAVVASARVSSDVIPPPITPRPLPSSVMGTRSTPPAASSDSLAALHLRRNASRWVNDELRRADVGQLLLDQGRQREV